jgi:hypothetical protein
MPTCDLATNTKRVSLHHSSTKSWALVVFLASGLASFIQLILDNNDNGSREGYRSSPDWSLFVHNYCDFASIHESSLDERLGKVRQCLQYFTIFCDMFSQGGVGHESDARKEHRFAKTDPTQLDTCSMNAALR